MKRLLDMTKEEIEALTEEEFEMLYNLETEENC